MIYSKDNYRKKTFFSAHIIKNLAIIFSLLFLSLAIWQLVSHLFVSQSVVKGKNMLMNNQILDYQFLDHQKLESLYHRPVKLIGRFIPQKKIFLYSL